MSVAPTPAQCVEDADPRDPRWRAALRVVLDRFRLDVEIAGGAGVLAVVGENGSGKTTLLRALAGAVPTERAEVVIGDRTLASSARGIDTPMERRCVGYVPQGYGLFPHLDVRDNVAFGLRAARGLARGQARERASTLLAELGLEALARRAVGSLSGGERQRVALARALVLEPELLLLDEPLAALDATTRRAVRLFLAERLVAFGRPSVIVTHDVRDVAALDARVCVLAGGRVLQVGELAELRAAPASDFVREFLALS